MTGTEEAGQLQDANRTARAQRFSAFATLLLAVATLGLAIIGGCQIDAAHEELGELQRSNDHLEDTIRTLTEVNEAWLDTLIEPPTVTGITECDEIRYSAGTDVIAEIRSCRFLRIELKNVAAIPIAVTTQVRLQPQAQAQPPLVCFADTEVTLDPYEEAASTVNLDKCFDNANRRRRGSFIFRITNPPRRDRKAELQRTFRHQATEES